MKKFLLLVFIALCGAFIYLKVSALGDPNSYFNQTTRFTLGKYQIMRTVLGLHNDGDARAWYLQGTSQLDLEVVDTNAATIDQQGLDDFAAKVGQYTGRPVVVYHNDKIPGGTLTDTDLAGIVKGFRRHVLPGQPNLFVIYADDYQRADSEVGKTYREFGIVLSDKRLKEVTSQFSQSMPQYVESTLLHEFGHQLGLDHNDQSGCIMNPKVDKPDVTGEFTGSFTAISYCDFELQQLNAIKAGLK